MKVKKYIIKNKETIVFLLPSLLGVMIFVLIPFLDSMRRAFFSFSSKKFVGIENYGITIHNEAFILAVKNTLKFTIVCIPLLVIISFFISYTICKLRYIRLIKSVFLFPLAVPTSVLVLVWKILFSDFGYINYIITSSGNESISFLGSSTAFWVLVGSYLWKNMGYTMLLWITGIMSVSTSFIEAAKVDGASEWKIMTNIVLPNLKPTLYTITIISFLNSFKVFREAYLVAGPYPHESIYLMQHLFNNWFIGMDLEKIAVAATMLFLVILVAIILLQKVWDKET